MKGNQKAGIGALLTIHLVKKVSVFSVSECVGAPANFRLEKVIAQPVSGRESAARKTSPEGDKRALVE